MLLDFVDQMGTGTGMSNVARRRSPSLPIVKKEEDDNFVISFFKTQKEEDNYLSLTRMVSTGTGNTIFRERGN
jgi:hypothetical protein